MTVHDPETCQCADCLRRWFQFLNSGEVRLSPQEIESVRSHRPKIIEVSAIRGKGAIPAFLPLFQRHFEKSNPTVASTKEATVIAPLDLLSMIAPADLIKSIESIEVTYRRPA